MWAGLLFTLESVTALYLQVPDVSSEGSKPGSLAALLPLARLRGALWHIGQSARLKRKSWCRPAARGGGFGLRLEFRARASGSGCLD